MAAIQRWIVSVTATALLTGLCRLLMPQGSARRVGAMVCALLLFTAIVAPLGQVRLETLSDSVSAWAQQYEGYSGELEETNRQLERGLIEERCAAYLEDRARALGCPCAAAVECAGEEGVPVPVRVTFFGVLGPEQREQLSALAASELGVEQVAYSEQAPQAEEERS